MNKFIKSIVIKSIVLVVSVLFTNASYTEVVVNVNKGVRKAIPISISVYNATGGIEPDIFKVVENDLKSCGLFASIDPRAFLEKLRGAGQKPRFDLWKAIRSQYLVNISAMNDAGVIHIAMSLYDIYAQKKVGYFSISGQSSQMRLMAHMISNKVYEYIIGEKGYFDAQVLYVSTTRGKKGVRSYSISIMDQDGYNNRRLTNGAFMVLTPRISPNSHEFAYFLCREKIVNKRRVPLDACIYIYNLKTGKSRLIRTFKGMSYAPRFSPNGTVLIFSLTHRGSSSIYTYDMISGKISRLTKGPQIDTSPCYSPDGRKIVFNSDRAGRQRLYVMDADGRNVRPLGRGNGRYATPVWSPRGDWIAFTKFGVGGFYIGICRPDGSDERMLSSGYLVEGPTWSNNGHVLMFSHQDYYGRRSIFSVDITGHNKRQIKTATEAIDPEWSTAKSDEALKNGKIRIHQDMVEGIGGRQG